MKGEDIKKIRLSKGLTQQQFADILEIDRGLISSMENGKKNVTKSTEILINNYIKEYPTLGQTDNYVDDPSVLYKKMPVFLFMMQNFQLAF